MEFQDLGNLINYTAMPLIENYKGKYARRISESVQKEYELIEFNYSDGTADSYVKRGFDEIYVQKLTRVEGLEQSYRIFTTNTAIDFKPKETIILDGGREMRIVKVLPLMNTNDNIRMYNFAPSIYRRMAVKLIYLE